MIKLKLRDSANFIGGHLLENISNDTVYIATPFKIGRVTNHTIIDDKGKQLWISNGCIRRYFIKKVG